MHALRRDIRAALFNQRHITIPHRMRHRHERQRGVANTFRRHLRQWREGSAHHGNRRDAQRLKFGRVTRGPWG